MAGRAGEGFGSLFLTFIILGMILAIASLVTTFALFAIPAYVGYRLWKENPKRLERLSREETQILYDHAIAGTVKLTDDEIDAGIAQHWPPDLPASLRVQLLDVGRAVFAQEGLSPDIAPMPALCNTVEGARYRDMLAKAGQARSDRVMVTSALDIISEALAPIANAVPPIEGDVLVEVTLDLSRFDAAPLIAFIATKEMNYGNETNGRISQGCGAYRTDQRTYTQASGG